MGNEKDEKRAEETEKDYQEKIKKLEKKVEELEMNREAQMKKEEETSIVGDVVSQFIPGLGNIVKTLEKTSPEFRKRIAETDAEIKHRLETGWNGKPEMKYGISIRPFVSERKEIDREEERKEVDQEEERKPEKEPIVDIFEEDDYVTVIAEIPGASEKDIKTELKGNILEISARGFSKTIILPAASRSVVGRTYKNGVLQLKIDKQI